jgi:Alw26I/Eco31I/Esp3I family type II restriction m6 adenine DNA methyltransferase
MEFLNYPYKNSDLFSNYFLNERLPESNLWECSGVENKFEEIYKLYTEKEKILISAKESQIEEEWIRPIFKILELFYIPQPPAPVLGTVKEPDYAFYASEVEKNNAYKLKGNKRIFESAIAVGDAKRWNVDLNNIKINEQLNTYLGATKIQWGILTNGKKWRIYTIQSGYWLGVYYEVDLPDLIKSGDLENFKYFYLFFRKTAFVKDGFLYKVYNRSINYSKAVSTDLKENVYEALQLLMQGFLDSNGELKPKNVEDIYQNSLILLYRLVFILYAEADEEKELLPMKNRSYREAYSLKSLKEEIVEKIQNGIDITTTSFHYWAMLKDLFRFIDKGEESLGIYEYNGGLFDSLTHEFLDDKYNLGDKYIASAIYLLTYSKTENGFIDYRDIDVREIGAIYEGLLEHKPVIKENKVRWDIDKSDRKNTGSYYTPDYIVKFIVANAIGPLIEDIEKEIAEEIEVLKQKIKKSRGYNREAYKKQLKEKKQRIRERVFDLNILDPAMGSGHFLVESTEFLAKSIAKLEARFLGVELEEKDTRSGEIDELKREIAEKSIFGVDKNPLATELAKLSLWLHTVAKGEPLTFLDHRLRTGDSLIGVDIDEMEYPISGKDSKMKGLFESKMIQDLATAIRHLLMIEEIKSQTRRDIQNKKTEWREVTAWIGRYKKIASVRLSRKFGNDIRNEQYRRALSLAKEHKLEKIEDDRFFRKAIEIAELKKFFHWELEFPDVFRDEQGREKDNAGFDAIIGNPPYDIISEKEQGKPVKQEKNYFKTNTVYTPAVYGKLNLYRLFILLSIKLLRKRGIHSFICPMSLLADKQAKKIRDFILSNFRVLRIEAFPQKDKPSERVFPDAKLSTCIYFMEKSMPGIFKLRINPGRHIVEKTLPLSLKPEDIYEFDSENLSIPAYPWITKADFQLALKLNEITDGRKLRDFTSSFQGEVNLTSDSMYLSENPSNVIVLRGAHIGRYEFQADPKQGKPQYLKISEFLKNRTEDTKAYDYRFPRIGYQRGSAIDNWRRIIATVLEEGVFCSDTINYIKATQEINLYTILAFLNSYLWEWRFRLTSTNNHVNSYEIDSLPLSYVKYEIKTNKQNQKLNDLIKAYEEFLNKINSENIMYLTDQCIHENNVEIIYSLLAYLSKRMVEMNKRKQKLWENINAIFTNNGVDVEEYSSLSISKSTLEYIKKVQKKSFSSRTKYQSKIALYGKKTEQLFGNSLEHIYKNRYFKFEDLPKLGFEKFKWLISIKGADPNILDELREDVEPKLEELIRLLKQIGSGYWYPKRDSKTVGYTPMEEIQSTDWLIDQIIYKLYNLTYDEVKIVDPEFGISKEKYERYEIN